MSELTRVGSFGVYGFRKQLVISISHEDMARAKHIVSKATQEAQWFHRVARFEDEGRVIYHLHGTYVTPQYVSAAEVETDDFLFIEYWNELQDKYGPDEASNILRESGAWCHSHVNMEPVPSGQDNTKFQQFVKLAKDETNTTPQIMMILNKKDKVYTRVWDPQLDSSLVFENLPILVQPQYDFSDLDKQLDTKLRRRVVQTVVKEQAKSDSPKGGQFLDPNQILEKGWWGKGSESSLGSGQTTSGSSWNGAMIPHDDDTTIRKALQELQELNGTDALNTLMNTTGKYLKGTDWIALEALLFGNKQSCYQLAYRNYLNGDKKDVDTAFKEIIDALQDPETLVDGDVFIYAAEAAMDLRLAATNAAAKVVVEDYLDWWSNYFSEPPTPTGDTK